MYFIKTENRKKEGTTTNPMEHIVNLENKEADHHLLRFISFHFKRLPQNAIKIDFYINNSSAATIGFKTKDDMNKIWLEKSEKILPLTFTEIKELAIIHCPTNWLILLPEK